MALELENLDARTRDLMLDELEHDRLLVEEAVRRLDDGPGT
jgi:hypothetical protein